MAQSAPDAARLSNLGAENVGFYGNLKAAAAPLPVDERELRRFGELLHGRPVWLAASTHPGEEEQVLRAHASLRADHPELLLLLVPRHPERGPDVAALAREAGLEVRRRAGLEPLDRAAAVYVADTIGELGLFYRLAPLVFVGGSLVRHGGQNPLEAARIGCALVWGPHMFNFLDQAGRLVDAGAAIEVPDGAGLAAEVDRLLRDGELRTRRIEAARAVADEGEAVIEHVMEALVPLLEERLSTGRIAHASA